MFQGPMLRLSMRWALSERQNALQGRGGVHDDGDADEADGGSDDVVAIALNLSTMTPQATDSDEPGPADLKERRQGEQENGPGDRHGGRVQSPLVMMALRRSSRRQNIRQRAPGGAGTTTTPEPWQQSTPRRSARQDLAKRRQVKLSAFADAVAPGLALVQAIDRWATGSIRNFGRRRCGVATDRLSAAALGSSAMPRRPAEQHPASPSAMPSIRAEGSGGGAGRGVSRLGSRAGGISWLRWRASWPYRCPLPRSQPALPLPGRWISHGRSLT